MTDFKAGILLAVAFIFFFYFLDLQPLEK